MMAHQIFSRWGTRWIASLALTFVVALTVVLSASPAWAQASAAINGTVRDTAGAVIVGATVVLHNRDTALDRSAVTNGVGSYVLTNVLPGNYDLKVTMNGFGPAAKTSIELLVNQTGTYDFTLKAGAVNEVVEVQDNPVTLETSTSELGVAVVKEQVNDLPLNGRNFTQLLNLTPGVSTVNVSQNSATSGGVWSNPIGTFSYPSVNGQTNRSNLFLLDGINNNTTDKNQAPVLPSSMSRALIACCGGAGVAPCLPTQCLVAPGASAKISAIEGRSYTTCSAAASNAAPRRVSNSGSPGPAPTR